MGEELGFILFCFCKWIGAQDDLIFAVAGAWKCHQVTKSNM